VDTTTLVALSFVFFAAFVTESAVGFGGALLVVSLGAQVLAPRELLPVFQPLALGLSALLLWRGRAAVDVRFFLRTLLPAITPGVLVGMVLFRVGRPDLLLLLVGIAISALASFELWGMARGQLAAPLPAPLVRRVLFAAGIMHGLFGSSGPPVVWVASRVLPDKTIFRATLSLLWFTLSLMLLAGFAADGTLHTASLLASAKLVPALLLGFVLGDRLHARVPQRAFRLVVAVLLVVAGLLLCLRALT
jgi:uncharacterized protein